MPLDAAVVVFVCGAGWPAEALTVSAMTVSASDLMRRMVGSLAGSDGPKSIVVELPDKSRTADGPTDLVTGQHLCKARLAAGAWYGGVSACRHAGSGKGSRRGPQAGGLRPQ